MLISHEISRRRLLRSVGQCGVFPISLDLDLDLFPVPYSQFPVLWTLVRFGLGHVWWFLGLGLDKHTHTL